MKAIRKTDGCEVDVILLHPKEYVETVPTADYPALGGKRIYRADDLVIDEPIDWEDFRRMAALNIYGICQAKVMTVDYEALARNAVEQADVLVKCLKEKYEQETK